MRTVHKSNIDEHVRAIKEMEKFFESDEPYVGIFWLNPVKMTLFGVQKGEASLYANKQQYYTYPKLHKTYWQKQHNKAIATKNTKSIFYNESDYTKIPRGRIFVDHGIFQVKVGNWISDVDIDQLSELLIDEFNLPDNFQYDQDSHWDLGKGWSEEKF